MTEINQKVASLFFQNPVGEKWDDVEGVISLTVTGKSFGIDITIRQFKTGTKTDTEFVYRDHSTIRGKANEYINEYISDVLRDIFDDLELEIIYPPYFTHKLLYRYCVPDISQDRLTELLDHLIKKGLKLTDFSITRYVSRNDYCTFRRMVTYNNKCEIKSVS